MVHRFVSLVSTGLSVFVCLLFLEVSAAGQEAGSPIVAGQSNAEKSRHQLTIVTLGDSITKGVRKGVTSQQTFASLLEKELQKGGVSVRVINVGIGGERTDQALKRLDRIFALKPDIVTIMYGTNDSYVDRDKTASRITVDEYQKNLNAIVVEFLRRGIQPVLMTAPRWSDDARPNGLGENPNVRLDRYIVACRKTAKK
jgi:acyl-CoA thioesterase-1